MRREEEEAAARSMDALWAQNVVTAADGYPRTDAHLQGGGAGRQSRIATAAYGYYVHESRAAGHEGHRALPDGLLRWRFNA